MSEAAPEAPAQESTEPPTEQPAEVTNWEAEATRLRDELAKARKWEERAKENKKAADELAKQRQASMTETERAVAEAEQRGRTAATQEYGKRLATSEIRAEAAGAGADLGNVFEYLDLGRFVGEDGEPDGKAIKTFVDSLPRKTEAPPSFDGGTRTPAPAAGSSMSQLIRQAAGRA